MYALSLCLWEINLLCIIRCSIMFTLCRIYVHISTFFLPLSLYLTLSISLSLSLSLACFRFESIVFFFIFVLLVSKRQIEFEFLPFCYDFRLHFLSFPHQVICKYLIEQNNNNNINWNESVNDSYSVCLPAWMPVCWADCFRVLN